MKTARSLALGILMAFGSTPARTEAAASPANPHKLGLELESQVPCFFFGGYQLALGARYERFRLRAGVIDSGRFDVEPWGMDNQKSRFQRSFDDGSVRLYADYFLCEHLYVGALVASHRWRVRSEATSATAHLRTLDAGVGAGFQYVFYRGIYFQPVFHVFFRERQSLAIGGEEYRIAGVELNGAFRLGVKI